MQSRVKRLAVYLRIEKSISTSEPLPDYYIWCFQENQSVYTVSQQPTVVSPLKTYNRTLMHQLCISTSTRANASSVIQNQAEIKLHNRSHIYLHIPVVPSQLQYTVTPFKNRTEEVGMSMYVHGLILHTTRIYINYQLHDGSCIVCIEIFGQCIAMVSMEHLLLEVCLCYNHAIYCNAIFQYIYIIIVM